MPKNGLLWQKVPKIAKRWAPPLASGEAPRPLIQVKRLRNVPRPYSHWRFLIDADVWQFGSKTKLIFYIFCPPVQKTCPCYWLFKIYKTKTTFIVLTTLRRSM